MAAPGVLRYDPQQNQYYVQDASGNWRPISGQQATSYGALGYDTVIGAPFQMGPPPVPSDGSSQPAPPVDPYADWQNSDQGTRSWRYLGDDATKKFYEDNPQYLWTQYSGDMFGGRQTPLNDYANSNYGRYYSDYLRWSEADQSGQRTFADYLNNNLAGQIRRSFSQESPSIKGYTNPFMPSGRSTY